MVIKVSSIIVKNDQALEFLNTIVSALKSLSIGQLRSLYLLHNETKSVVVSFDGSYSPFLGFTYGYNYPDARVELRQCWILKQIGDLARIYNDNNNYSIPGGRAFISKCLVKIHGNIPLCFLEWQGFDPYSICKKLLN